MNQVVPEFPEGRPRHFRSTVHGTCFAGREQLLETVAEGDELCLITDPPGQEDPEVWVHLMSGDPVGHLPPEICAWLWPWIVRGGRAQALASRVHGANVPSWRRLVLEVHCGADETT